MDKDSIYTSYASPFSWRYGSPAMRKIWSESTKRLLWRKIWLALAEVQASFGLISQEQVDEIREHAEEINLQRALEIEANIHHDLMAELKIFAEQCPSAGGVLHLGATSMDIEDNAEVLRIKSALKLLLEQLASLLLLLTESIETWADEVIIAYTHLQPAEPTTLGYRIAGWTQDLWMDWQQLNSILSAIKGKGFKGAVGSGASYLELLGITDLISFEEKMAEKLKIDFYSITNQVAPRKQEYWLLSGLASLAGSLYKAALDLRFLQTPSIGEISEPFETHQVGSSAMPFKRNPILAEKINSLGRYVAQLPRIAWDNAANSMLERTLDDSANRRLILAEAFLACDEMLACYSRIVKGWKINREIIQRNREVFMPFAATEKVLLAACKAGADRQLAHEKLRILSLQAWEAVQKGQKNPLMDLIRKDTYFSQYIKEEMIIKIFEERQYVGDVAKRGREFAQMVRIALQENHCKEKEPA